MAISPCPKLTALDRNPRICQILRLWSPVASSRLQPQELAIERHFSTDVGTERPVRAVTAGRTVGFTPRYTGSFCPSLNLVMCWPHSRSSARGPGWPARPRGATEMNG